MPGLRRVLTLGASVVLLAAPSAAHAAPAGPWDAFNLSPSATRTQLPRSIARTVGAVSNPQAVLSGGATTLSSGGQVTLDFGQEVGGTVTLHASGSGQIGLAFAESSAYIDVTSDATTGGPRGRDGAIMVDVSGPTDYTTPLSLQRGGFRYLTLFLASGTSVDVDAVSVHYTAAPTMPDPRDYANYFYSSDDELNRIWYAGAYTVETNTIAPTQGRTWPAPDALWSNTGVVGVGDTILTDGAKRDRTVWPGDLGISFPTAYASLGDTVSTRNALTTMYDHQSAGGALPYSGPPLSKSGSDTYHLWTLSATGDYYDVTADRGWLDSVWSRYKLGMDFILAKLDDRGLLYMTTTLDSSDPVAKGERLSANVLMWKALAGGARLAAVEGDSAVAADYAARAAALKAAIDAYLWDEAAGMYKLYPDSSVHPQDGNALAVWYGLVDSPARAARISQGLQRTWTAYGAPTPESKSQLKTFPASMEVMAHFAAGADQAGVDLIRREWGFMLHDPLGTQSTFPEALRDNGCICSTYTSMSHGWATGPTAALTEYVLGLAPASPGGATWTFTPHPADLTFARGRLQTTRGALDASWKADTGRFSAQLSAPAGTSGRIAVPTFGRSTAVWLDGTLIGNTSSGSYVYLDDVAGGTHTVDAYPSSSVTSVGGTVPSTLSLTLGSAGFGAFTLGVTHDYTATLTADVVSTAGDATLAVADPSGKATGHLVNGAFALPRPLEAGSPPAPLHEDGTPLTVQTYAGPVSRDQAAITLTQPIGAGDALRTGSYSKTLTFTLSTSNP
jgi:hypothetical protein